MLLNLSKVSKKNSNPFCTKGKSKKQPAANLSDENKRCLAATDKGSYFDQDKQWPELLSKNINNNNANLSSSISRDQEGKFS